MVEVGDELWNSQNWILNLSYYNKIGKNVKSASVYNSI